MSDETAHEAPSNPEIHFEPIVNLPAIEIKSLEDNEEELFQIRAKLYRYDSNGEESDWKERGVGVLRILKHKQRQAYRVLMRRDKTLKICANHFITKDMQLKPNCGSDRAWVWSVAADFADEESKSETLAAKFGNAENAQKFRDKFEECQKLLSESTSNEEQESEKLAKELEGLNVKESKETDQESEKADEKKESDSGEASTSTTEETKDKKKEEDDVPEK